MDGGGLEDAHELDLPLAAAGADGDDKGTELLRAVVQAEPAGEQPVAHHVLEHIPSTQPHHVETARHQLGPARDVARGVEDRGGQAGGAGRVMQAYHPILRHRQETEGVAVAQVLLAGQREAAQIIERVKRLRAQAETCEHLRIVLGLRGLADAPAKAFELEGAEGIGGGGFDWVVGLGGRHQRYLDGGQARRPAAR